MTDTGSLPDGFTVRLNSSVRRYDDGRTLVGGSPTTAVHLSDTARRMLKGPEVQVTDAKSRALADRLLELGMADPVLDELPSLDTTQVTVVVPVHDRPRQLELLLGSIPRGLRVIVVDDRSTNPAAILAVAEAHGAEVIRHEVNTGPAAARNTGLRRVDSPFVAFIDSDVVLEADTLSILLRHFHDPKVSLAAPRILGRHPTGPQSWITRYENSRASLDLGRKPGLVRPRAPVAWVPGACLVGRVAALGNGFDATLRVAEDVDLVWRLAGQGWRIRYEPAATARHEHRSALGDWWTRKTYYGTGAHLLAVRHGRDVAPAVLSPWAATTAVALLAQRRSSLPLALMVSLAAAGRISKKIDRSDERRRIGLALTATGVAAALSQSSALMLRHWWPMAFAASCFAPRARRALITAAVLDSALEYQRTDTDLDPIRFAVARRLDDIAYGLGVWSGALRHRSIGCLLPDLRVSRATHGKRRKAVSQQANGSSCGPALAG
jgi:mycofactocin system glycosyltransferase